mgnify:CR=1 FL=1|tara:strand:- start:520 stop:723 length:204 start_codon:yes stop_codon:yes gene_type:complete
MNPMNYLNIEDKFNFNTKNKSKNSRRSHQKKDNQEKKELTITRKKLSRLITRKMNKNNIRKTQQYII